MERRKERDDTRGRAVSEREGEGAREREAPTGPARWLGRAVAPGRGEEKRGGGELGRPGHWAARRAGPGGEEKERPAGPFRCGWAEAKERGRDHRPSVGKLDPRAVKCIFVGYSSVQKGYKCWSPSERRLFVSMDVTFRESEPFYGEKTDLSSLFSDLDYDITGGDCQEGEKEALDNENNDIQSGPIQQQSRRMKAVISGSGPQQRMEVETNELNPAPSHENNSEGDIRYKGPLKVYTRRKSRAQVETPITIPEHSSPSSLEIVDVSSSSEIENEDSTLDDLPIALRKEARVKAGVPRPRYGFENDISNYVSYASLSPAYRAFVASLQSVVIPRDWKQAKQDPKWNEAMLEELRALEKNKTWELVKLPAGKKVVSCKWVFSAKQNPAGKVERYKARLVARGYSQTYGIDYDETFAPVAKMSTVRMLISCAANFGWPLHQLDVKNAFLHGDLQEEVYMEIPSGFSKPDVAGKCNRDHTVFYRHSGRRIVILAVYVDDIIITGHDEAEINRLKEDLSKVFEVKDLGQLKYFLGIEIARSAKGIFLSQRKYVLDLLSETGMLGCRPAPTPIDPNHKLCATSGDPVNKESYQRLVGRLIYLCHTRPDISYAVSVVSRYMHDLRSGHLNAAYRILRYLKNGPGKGLMFKSHGHLNVEGYCDADWASCLDDRRSTSGYCVFVGGNLISWRSKKQPVVSRSSAEAEYRAMSLAISEMMWVKNLLSELYVLRKGPLKLWCDNKSAINIANNPVQHDRTKHVEIDRFFIKEKLDSGVLELRHVNSSNQVADCLTKGTEGCPYPSLDTPGVTRRTGGTTYSSYGLEAVKHNHILELTSKSLKNEEIKELVTLDPHASPRMNRWYAMAREKLRNFARALSGINIDL
ncbi:hypothetical protein U9M48_032584 [Paspalum notatum var. saurae]|uniref:Reverse transcriptase Ty1/copia-type domain-containing protein n=1 Tax=Paspalum notatum var. saurae TaxID=547442 RepID=A0AAQ3U7M1_PASNO